MRIRRLTVADLPAIQTLHASVEGSGVLGTWDAARLGVVLFRHLTDPGSKLVALVAVLGARIKGSAFTGGKPKGLLLAMRGPAELGTLEAAHVELLTVHPSFQTWRGRPVAALLLRALAAQGPVAGLSPEAETVRPARAPVPTRAAHRLAGGGTALRGDGAGIGPDLSVASGRRG